MHLRVDELKGEGNVGGSQREDDGVQGKRDRGMKRTRVRASLFSVDARTPSLKQYPGARARSRQDDEDEVEKGGWLKEGPQARARRRGHFILTSSDDKTCSETSA